MDNSPSHEADHKEEDIWSERKAASSLTSSEFDMSDQRKKIIQEALKFNIVDIRSYTGYKGDLLVEITTMDPAVIASLKKTAETLGFETVIQQDIISIYKIFCITPSSNGYDLK